MTRRVLNQVHDRLALARYRQLRAEGATGRVAVRAFDDTRSAALTAYRRLPPWRRHWYRR